MSQYLYLGTQNLSGKVYGGFQFSGMTWKVKQDGATSLETGARLDQPDGSFVKFEVGFANATDAATFLAYCATKQENADIPLYLRDDDWYFRVWCVQVKNSPISQATPMDWMTYCYEVTAYFYGPYSHSGNPVSWHPNHPTTLPSSSGAISNADGFYAICFESLELVGYYDSGHVLGLTLAIADSLTLTIADEVLSDEIWTLYGLLKILTEVYEDTITSSTKWDHDTVGDGTFDTDHIELDNGESAYYKLSGPHPSNKTVKMTADLSLDSGGATGKAYIEVSEDGQAWIQCFDELFFSSGSAIYYLNGTEFEDDIYVRFRCASGTAGKKLNIGSVKFEVERSVADNLIPTIPAAGSKVATVDASTGSHSAMITGTFRPMRLLI